jgi:hypothetical protein
MDNIKKMNLIFITVNEIQLINMDSDYEYDDCDSGYESGDEEEYVEDDWIVKIIKYVISWF